MMRNVFIVLCSLVCGSGCRDHAGDVTSSFSQDIRVQSYASGKLILETNYSSSSTVVTDLVDNLKKFEGNGDQTLQVMLRI
jgi:hypothetical protein